MNKTQHTSSKKTNSKKTSDKSSKLLFILASFFLLLFLLLTSIVLINKTNTNVVTDFESCVASTGSTILYTYPGTCITKDGQQFTESTTLKPSPVSSPPSNSLEAYCISKNGTWLAEFNECEYIDLDSCIGMKGQFNECGSACRHDKDFPQTICTMNCVPYCSF